MKKLIALLLAIVMLFSLVGCSAGYTEEDLTAAKEEAYEDGYNDAQNAHECEYSEMDVEDAYHEGYADAESEHECEYDWDDIDEARDEGYDEGYNEGHDDGYYGGYDTGYADGYSDGYADGEDSGYTASSYSTDYSSSYTTMVYIPRTGSKYHSNSACSGMKNPSHVSLDDAIAWGYTACKNCY